MRRIGQNPSTDDVARAIGDLQREVDLLKAGPARMRGPLDMNGYQITNLGPPLESHHAQTRVSLTGSYAPASSRFVVIGPNDADLSAERVLTAGANITITDNGANGSVVIDGLAGTVTSIAVTGANGIGVSGSPITTAGTIALTLGSLSGLTGISSSGTIAFSGLSSNGLVKTSGGTGTLSVATSGTDYEVPLTFSTGLTRSTNTITVNTSQNIATLSNLTTNGFVKTSGGTGTLSIDTSTYLTGNQTITLSGAITGSGATSITTSLGSFTSSALATALTDETGSGAAVFAGSPTFTGTAHFASADLSSLTSGRVTFAGASGLLSDSSSLQWDNTNKWLAVGATPAYPLQSSFTSTVTSSNSRNGYIEITASPSGASTGLYFGLSARASTLTANNISSSGGIFAGEIKAMHSGTGTIDRVVGTDSKAIAGIDIGASSNAAKFGRLQGGIFYANDNSTRSGTATRIDGIATQAYQFSPGTTTYMNGVSAAYGLADGGSGAGTVTAMSGIRIWPIDFTNDTDIMQAGTVTNFYGVKIDDPTSGPTYTNAPEAIHIDSFTPTGSLGIRQVSTSMTNRFAGNTRIGADTAPTVALDVTGAALVSSTLGVTGATTLSSTLGVTGAVTLTNKVTTYNNTSTVERGMPYVIASVTSAASNAAVAATNLIASTPATGFYRVTVQLSQTVAASTSAILGPVTIAWTDGNNSSAQSIDVQGTTLDAAGNSTSASSSARNTTTTKLHGSIVIYALTGTAITYAVAYTSVGGTAMVYRYRLLLEAI